jgi:hypothetical protein
MNALQNDQEPRTDHQKESLSTISDRNLTRMAKPIGIYAGAADSVLRFRNGELVAADTGDQGGGQN